MESSLNREEKPKYQAISMTVGNGEVTALTLGDGPAIVLFHSLLADRSSFDLIAQPLSQTHKVVLLNLPGFGSSSKVGPDLAAVADRIAAAIKGFGLGAPPIFLGNGYGAFIAITLAVRHPGIASRLALTGCGATFSEPGRAAFRQMSVAAQRNGLGTVADVAMRRLFSPEYQAKHPQIIAERKKRFLAVDPQTFYQACEALALLDLRSELAELDLPVLVLVGEGDEATPPPMAQELVAGLPNARLHVLPGCAHVPQLQAPALFLSAIKDFIESD
ncbi:MAG: alpha/beta fold hydrolase [Paralcaligenes sp.]